MELSERSAALERLEGLLRRSADGGRVAIVSGEAGLGKSALIAEFARRCGSRARVLWGACDRLVTPRVLGPLQDIGRQTGGVLAARLGAGAPQAEVFAAFLDELSGPRQRARPVVVVEDAHWADEATLDWLVFLGRRVDRVAALLVLTYRDDELGPDHPLRGALAALPSRAVDRITLSVLSAETVAEQAVRAGRDPAVVHRLTGGNPLLLTELLKNDDVAVPADWPIQSRIIEIGVGGPANARTLSIFTTMLDIDAPIVYDDTTEPDLTSPRSLAGFSRLLAVNDPVERPRARRGTATDRNLQLLLPAPFAIADPVVTTGRSFFAAGGTGYLWQIDENNKGGLAGNGLGLDPGSTPAAAMDRFGATRVAFHAGVTHWLWTLDVGGGWRPDPHGLGVAIGTSPAIAAPVDLSGFRIAFHGYQSGLWFVDESGTPIDTKYVMRADASPAIASSPLGGWLTAWVDDADFLYQLDQSGAYRRSGNGLGVRAGTNPSVAGPDPVAEVANASRGPAASNA
jgi:hypothetical protein